MRRFILIFIVFLFAPGCRSVREAEIPHGQNISIMTYNIHWNCQRPDIAIEIISRVNADIVCLQETTSTWQSHIRNLLKDEYRFMAFRDSMYRTGGGLAFLSKHPVKEIAYIPSDSGWFDGWIMAFMTPIGEVQINNVHLHPPVNKEGRFGVVGYFSSDENRVYEIERFYEKRNPSLPLIVAGDFNETEKGKAAQWLTRQGLIDSLSEFDHDSHTWRSNIGILKLRRRIDHIIYSKDLYCYSAQVVNEGISDHFPVVAVFGRAKEGGLE